MGVVNKLKTKDFVTLSGTFCGVFALVVAVYTTAFRFAFLFVFLSLVFDLFDGFVARKLDQINELGKQLDSLSDAFCFAVVPSIIYFRIYTLETSHSAFSAHHPLVLLVPCFIFIAGGILRLAWFNIASEESYTGLVTPLSAGFLLLYHMLDYYSSVMTEGVTGFNVFVHYSVPFVLVFVGWLNVTEKLYYGKEIRKKQGVKNQFIFFAIFITTTIILAIGYMESVVLLILLLFLFLMIYLLKFIIEGYLNYRKLAGE